MRTLAADHPDYVGRYEGEPDVRDAAYHQGTVWPWPIGGYVDAMLAVHGGSADVKARCREALLPLIESLDDAGIGQISEVYDGDAPHRPSGTVAQAWSVAEVLRAWMRVR